MPIFNEKCGGISLQTGSLVGYREKKIVQRNKPSVVQVGRSHGGSSNFIFFGLLCLLILFHLILHWGGGGGGGEGLLPAREGWEDQGQQCTYVKNLILRSLKSCH